MQKTILLTGATDGIGLETGKLLVGAGHHVLLHGRNPAKLAAAEKEVAGQGTVETFLCDLSDLADVERFAATVAERHEKLDVLINNAGILKTPEPITAEGLDVRFVVNTLAPYLLTRKVLPLMGPQGRVVNLSSAAQAPVSLEALAGPAGRLSDMEAYAQSKLAITQWSRHLAQELDRAGPAVIAVNPGSLLASKMVKEGFGIAGNDLSIGAEILIRAALSEDFAAASGRYYDNDSKAFADPHPDGLDAGKAAALVRTMEAVLGDKL
ncbi:MAG: SDR family NAD(P)-dependent oxidoreductase [Pseudomonadota bacterium]